MPVLPVPMIIAFLLFGLLLHRIFTRETHNTLLILIASCALQSALIALVRYYGFTSLRIFQPLLATLIPSIAWLAFHQAARGDVTFRDMLIHSSGLMLALVCLIIQPEWLDALIPIVFTAYGIAILLSLSGGEDSLPHSRLDGGVLPVLVWRFLALALIASAASDVLIAYNLAAGDGSVLLWLPSVFSSLILLVLGTLGFSHALEISGVETGDAVIVSQEEIVRDQAIIAKLDQYVQAKKPFLDPDLTLARLSRKLAVPEKQLSAAINKIKGENVSRFINQHRIKHACAIMLQGKTVTEAMLLSGFNTKSNFNREFLRVEGQSPSDWLRTQSALQDNTI